MSAPPASSPSPTLSSFVTLLATASGTVSYAVLPSPSIAQTSSAPQPATAPAPSTTTATLMGPLSAAATPTSNPPPFLVVVDA